MSDEHAAVDRAPVASVIAPETAAPATAPVAEQAVVTNTTLLRRAALASGFSSLPSAHSDTGLPRIQRSSRVGADGGPVDVQVESRIRAARSSGGSSLPGPVRRRMEGAFGSDFSSIRVHTGAESTDLNERIQAKAFTVGNDVFFRDGLPDASSRAGQHLLAHELAHTQQTGSRIARSAAVIRRTPQEDWLTVDGAFEGDSRPKWRKVFSSDNFKAIRTAVDRVVEAGAGTELRAIHLETLDGAIGTWLGDASDGNPRRDVVEQLRVEVARQRAFLTVLNPVVTAINDYRLMDPAVVTAALGQIDGLLADPLAQLDVYEDAIERITSRRDAVADRLAADAASAAAAAVGVAAIQGALGADRTPASIAREYRVFLDGHNMQYAPTGSETDVFVDPAGPADCSSVAQGLVKAARGLGVEARRVDCGRSYFLTAALPPTALPGPANITNATGDARFDGRRFFFPSHYVADVGGTQFCPVVGAPWAIGTHVELSGAIDGGGFTADLTGTPIEGADHEVTRVFPGSGVGIARSGDTTYLVRVVEPPH